MIFMKNFSHFILLTVLTLVVSLCAFAQTPITEAKRKLIADYLKVTKVEEDYGRSMDQMLGIMEMTYPATIQSAMDKLVDLSPKEREDMKKSLTERQLSISKKMRERYAKVVDIKQIIEEIYYPLYDKYYTEDELKDLIVFYSSPTGKKVTATSIEFGTESARLFVEKMTPKITKMVDEIIKEEIDGARPVEKH